MSTRMLIASSLFVLCSSAEAHAQVGWEVEWGVDLMLVDGDGMNAPAEGSAFFVKETLGREGNWLITSDDVWDARMCTPEVLALFPKSTAPGVLAPDPPAPLGAGDTYGLMAWQRNQQPPTMVPGRAPGNRRANRCYHGIIEFKNEQPRTAAVDIQNDMTALRNLMQRWRTDAVLPTVARTHPLGLAAPPPLPGVASAGGAAMGAGLGGCNNVFPCVLRLPYYGTTADAIAQVNPVPNKFWYVVITTTNTSQIRPQVNLNIPIRYFANTNALGNGPASTNTFVKGQFDPLWRHTPTWNFGIVLNDSRKGFFRLYGWYAQQMDTLARALNVPNATHFVAQKNALNPNPKFDFCALKDHFNAINGSLNGFYGNAGTIYRVQNARPRQVLQDPVPATAACRFVTNDVTLRPFLVAGHARPLFEFRHPGANQACFQLIDWVSTGAGNLGALAAQCHTDTSVF